jgi:hypothetical protein
MLLKAKLKQRKRKYIGNRPTLIITLRPVICVESPPTVSPIFPVSARVAYLYFVRRLATFHVFVRNVQSIFRQTTFCVFIFTVTPCINDIKHFNVQLMHTTLKT